MNNQRLSDVIHGWNRTQCGNCPYRNLNKCDKLHKDVSWFVANKRKPSDCPKGS